MELLRGSMLGILTDIRLEIEMDWWLAFGMDLCWEMLTELVLDCQLGIPKEPVRVSKLGSLTEIH